LSGVKADKVEWNRLLDRCQAGRYHSQHMKLSRITRKHKAVDLILKNLVRERRLSLCIVGSITVDLPQRWRVNPMTKQSCKWQGVFRLNGTRHHKCKGKSGMAKAASKGAVIGSPKQNA
jgi:hypothetical protein